jgi:hypothetical protein
VYDKLSPRRALACRRVDVVTVKGSKAPMTLYTYDIAMDGPNVLAATQLTECWIETQRHWKASSKDEGSHHKHGDSGVHLNTRDRVDACARSALTRVVANAPRLSNGRMSRAGAGAAATPTLVTGISRVRAQS